MCMAFKQYAFENQTASPEVQLYTVLEIMKRIMHVINLMISSHTDTVLIFHA